MTQDELLAKFNGHPRLGDFPNNLGDDLKNLFCRLARAVNSRGLDWWFTNANRGQIRFGRKELNTKNARQVAGMLTLSQNTIKVVGYAFPQHRNEYVPLTKELIDHFEEEDPNRDQLPKGLKVDNNRDGGYWPADYKRIENDQLESEESPGAPSECTNKNDSEGEPKSPKNVIYYGPPGTGKTFKLVELLKKDYTDEDYGQCYEFVTFHQSYGYEEFVEGLRPVIIKPGETSAADSEAASSLNGEVRYEIKPGAFLRLCDRARENPMQQYAMVIDEINRGNISKIFGELITLIEPDKRDPLDGGKPPIELTLAYSGEKFSVPANLDIIGTMNTADRSLALLDTALRRRFDFVPLLPDTRADEDPDQPHSAPLAGLMVPTTQAGEINVRLMLERINERIEALYDRDHTVGHAYFTHLKDVDRKDRFSELKTVFRNKIIPLLEEYFFEDWQKIRLVLGDNQKKDKQHQFVHEISREEDLLDLFGSDHELDQYASRRTRYQKNLKALDEPQAYVGIYDAKQQ